MFRVLRVLFFGALGLLLLIPVGIVLAVVGLPVVAILGLLALPLLLVLFLVGLPIMIIVGSVLALLGATFGVVVAFLTLGIVAVKLAFVVLVPILILGWIVRRVAAPDNRMRLRG
jgi:hypothetical protein